MLAFRSIPQALRLITQTLAFVQRPVGSRLAKVAPSKAMLPYCRTIPNTGHRSGRLILSSTRKNPTPWPLARKLVRYRTDFNHTFALSASMNAPYTASVQLSRSLCDCIHLHTPARCVSPDSVQWYGMEKESV